VQRTFDLIIIDCPPRLTTSEIQAFCASSHLLIPTILDRTSAEAVVSFRDQVETLKRADICPHLKYMGVVGTMWRPDRNAQRDALTFLKDALKNGPLGILDEEKFVRHSAALVNDASDGIAHIVMPNNQDGREARRAIAELSGYVAAKIGISRDSYFHEAAE
jgi:chromosome partitioning protein